MLQTKSPTTDTQSGDLSITRTYNAPRELLFELWTDPLHFAQWWAPDDHTMPICNLDPRPGGAIRIQTEGRDGTICKMTGSYREVRPPERLVFVNASLDERGLPLFEILHQVIITEQNGKSTQKMTARVIHRTPAAEKSLAALAETWKKTLRRFEKYLAETVKRRH